MSSDKTVIFASKRSEESPHCPMLPLQQVITVTCLPLNERRSVLAIDHPLRCSASGERIVGGANELVNRYGAAVVRIERRTNIHRQGSQTDAAAHDEICYSHN